MITAPTILLDMTYAGRVWRFSTALEEITALEEVYSPGLDVPAPTEQLDLFASEAAFPSVSLSIPLDVAPWAAQGHAPTTATARVHLWYSDADYRTILSGRVVQPVYAGGGGSMACSIEPASGQQAPDTIPRPTEMFSRDTHNAVAYPYSDDTPEGLYYPVVIGTPGSGRNQAVYSAVTFTRGSPAYHYQLAAGVHKVMVARGDVVAGTVQIWNNTDRTKHFAATVRTSTDLLGQRYSWVEAPVGDIPAAGDELWVGWEHSTGGGMPNPYGSGALSGAGDVVRWALEFSGLEWARSHVADLAHLNHISISTYLDDPVEPWIWAQDQVLPLTPASVVDSGDGPRIVPWRYWASQADAVAHLDTDENAACLGPLTWGPTTDLANVVTVRYLLRPDTDQLLHDVTVESPTSIAAYGRRETVVEAPVITDASSARSVAEYLLARMAHPAASIEVEVDHALGSRLDLGSVVTFSDVDLHMEARIAHVVSRTFGDESVSLSLVLFGSAV